MIRKIEYILAIGTTKTAFIIVVIVNEVKIVGIMINHISAKFLIIVFDVFG